MLLEQSCSDSVRVGMAIIKLLDQRSSYSGSTVRTPELDVLHCYRPEVRLSVNHAYIDDDTHMLSTRAR
jgi:hypothetical protein